MFLCGANGSVPAYPSYFSAGMGPYYRAHYGENKLSPKQQDDIMQILSQFGSTDGIQFDHYEMVWNFGWQTITIL